MRFLFVGTHSRKIEGDLIATLFKRGWKLEREKPCRFDGQGHTPILTGLTTDDGGQVWRNPRLDVAAFRPHPSRSRHP